jgi:hypothetical protein
MRVGILIYIYIFIRMAVLRYVLAAIEETRR